MIRRPKPGEDDDDILRMQEEFHTNKNQQPAAQVINLRKSDHQPNKRPSPTLSDSLKPSKYAKSKGLRIKKDFGSVIGDTSETNLENNATQKSEDDKVYFPKVLPLVLGDIVEKTYDDDFNLDYKPMPLKGFPIVYKQDIHMNTSDKNIIAHSLDKTIMKKLDDNMDIVQPSNSKLPINNESKVINAPSQSYMLSNEEAESIHSANIEVLLKMGEKEILQEKQKLVSTLDPVLIDFIRSKKKQSNIFENVIDVDPEDDTDLDTDHDTDNSNDFLWENDILSHPLVNQWLHCENLEIEKLEWLKTMEERTDVQTDHPYEARFDFEGYLLPYTLEYTEHTKTLFHHGEEPHRPGYSIIELFELTRSTVTQQRVMALNTIAGILNYYMAGVYKDVIEIPLSKIFFIIRIAMDENKLIVLEPALKAMRNLLYNRTDEACLDALLGFEEGTFQPCLENNKSEIEEIELEECEIKDFHLAEIDLIAAVLRTDIIQRIYYILEFVKPSFNSVHYLLQILIRLCRDSTNVANKIVQCEHLMGLIIKNFVPTNSEDINNKKVIYGKPMLAALKLIRVLSLQSKEVGDILITKYEILQPISAYISAGVVDNYRLKLQIESFCILSNLLNYDLGTEHILSLSPLIISMMYLHVQTTDITVKYSSILSVTHGAVTLQLVNKLLNSNILNLDKFKEQVYPLLQEGLHKWLMQLADSDSFKCGHLRILSAALDCCISIILNDDVKFQFLNDTLKMLCSSKGFELIVNKILPSSNLLSDIEDDDLFVVKNIVTLGGSFIDSTQRVLPILNMTSPIPFLASLFKLLFAVDDKPLAKLMITKILNYLQILSKKPPNLINNWLSRMEIEFISGIVKVSIQSELYEFKDLIYPIANKLCYILRVGKNYEVEDIFNNIIFNKQWFSAESLFNLISLTEEETVFNPLTTVENIRDMYSRAIHVNQMESMGNNIILKKWQKPVLPRDWIYLPILSLYNTCVNLKPTPSVRGNHADNIVKQEEAVNESIILCSLEWILFNEVSYPDLINDIDVTNRFCRVMCVFLCGNSLFLNKKINFLLRKCTSILYKYGDQFNFDKPLTCFSSFQHFYTQLLEQFQSVSYGDHTFASCVLVPIAQKHNILWRKILWSEYAGCLRVLNCPLQYLCYDVRDYMYPAETDKTLLKLYLRALSSNLIRPGTIAHMVASFHVACFKKGDFSVIN